MLALSPTFSLRRRLPPPATPSAGSVSPRRRPSAAPLPPLCRPSAAPLPPLCRPTSVLPSVPRPPHRLPLCAGRRHPSPVPVHPRQPHLPSPVIIPALSPPHSPHTLPTLSHPASTSPSHPRPKDDGRRRALVSQRFISVLSQREEEGGERGSPPLGATGRSRRSPCSWCCAARKSWCASRRPSAPWESPPRGRARQRAGSRRWPAAAGPRCSARTR